MEEEKKNSINEDKSSEKKKSTKLENDSTESKNQQKDISTLLHHLHIAHELAINEDLNSNLDLTKHDHDNIVRNALTEAYWNVFQEQISETPPKLELAFELLEEIKNSLDFVMTPNIKKLRQDVNQVLDLNAIKKQAEIGAIDVMYYAKYIIEVISKICAPVRDKQVEELRAQSDLIIICRGILELLSLMKYDLLNFSLKMIKPDIMANNLAYEREKFKEYIEAIGNNLPITQQWLYKHKNMELTSKQIVCNAFIDLLTWPKGETIPETLLLEVKRLEKLQFDYFRLTTSCTLYFLATGLISTEMEKLNCTDIDNDIQLKQSIKSFILIITNDIDSDDQIKNITMNIAQEIIKKLHKKNNEDITEEENSNTTTAILPEEIKLYQETLDQAANNDNKVRKLVCNRINDYLKQSLLIDPINSPAKSTIDEQDKHFPPSLNIFKKELHSLKLSFERIFTHNLLVCMEHYNYLLDVNIINKS